MKKYLYIISPMRSFSTLTSLYLNLNNNTGIFMEPRQNEAIFTKKPGRLNRLVVNRGFIFIKENLKKVKNKNKKISDLMKEFIELNPYLKNKKIVGYKDPYMNFLKGFIYSPLDIVEIILNNEKDYSQYYLSILKTYPESFLNSFKKFNKSRKNLYLMKKYKIYLEKLNKIKNKTDKILVISEDYLYKHKALTFKNIYKQFLNETPDYDYNKDFNLIKNDLISLLKNAYLGYSNFIIHGKNLHKNHISNIKPIEKKYFNLPENFNSEDLNYQNNEIKPLLNKIIDWK